MNILLSKILMYLNGTYQNDFYYKICKFIVFNYEEMMYMSEEELLERGPFQKLDLYSFIGTLGYTDYSEFQLTLDNNYQTRINQIRMRLFDTKPEIFMSKMEKTMTDEEMSAIVKEICEHFFECKRIVIFGAYYPLSIAVELQTDMITFGKPFMQHHPYDPITLNKDDVAIIMSSTGRSLDHYLKMDLHLEECYSVLLTQNKKYNERNSENCRVIVLPGAFESVDFNYQLMSICDLLRLEYFQQYYL